MLKFADQKRAEETLAAKGVKFNSRSEGMRLSPHIWNQEEEILLVADTLNTLTG